MGTLVQRRTPRMRETQQPIPSGLQYSGFSATRVTSPMSSQQPQQPQQPQPDSAKTKHILSRYRLIAPRPVAGVSTDQTTTDAPSVSSLSADNASTTTEYKPGKRSRKRPPDAVTKSGKKKPIQQPKTEEAIPQHVERHPHAGHGYNLTPLFPVGVAQKFGPGGWQRFHDSFDPRDPASGVSVSLSLSAATQSPAEHIALGLHVGGAGDDTGFMDRAARLQSSFGGENEVSRLFRPSESQFMGGGPSLSTSFGTESEVCSSEGSDKPDVVTLSLLPDTPSNVKAVITSTTLSTLPLLRSDLRWSTTARENPAMTSSYLNTSLTMSSTGPALDNTATETTTTTSMPGSPWSARTPTAADLGATAMDIPALEQQYGGSSEAVLLTDVFDQILWANAAFQRMSNEKTTSRAQAMGPHIDPLGVRTQLASLTFQPPFRAPKCKAVLWGFLKKIMLHKRAEDETPL